MVTFRFYVVSTVALFLALALGVVIGSALDEDLVAGLRNRVSTIDERSNRVARENDELRAEEERLAALIDSAAPHIVDGLLEGRPVLVVAERGVDADRVRAMRELAAIAGAEAPAILWLEEGWQLADETAREELATALDVTFAEPEVLRGRAWRLLLAQLGGVNGSRGGGSESTETTFAPGSPPTTGEPSTTPPPPTTLPPGLDVLGILDGAGLVSIETPADDGVDVREVMGTDLVMVIVSAPETDLSESNLMSQLLRLQAEVRMPTALASITADGVAAPVLMEVREDDALRAQIATIDNAELAIGRAATLLAVSDLGFAVVGHYGQLEGATRGLPEWTERAVAPG